MTPPRACQRYRLGPQGRYTLDLGAQALYADARVLPLGARAFELLAALVQAEGAAVTKDALLERGWPGLVVVEANLHVQVSGLRRLLGADAIATVPSVGYRWAWPALPDEATGPRHNLPAERTTFFGRSALLQAAHAALGRCRLLSLVGIGGAGKTRLALALGRQLVESLADGVWWVDLGPLDRADEIPAAVARAVGIGLSEDDDTAGQVARALQSRQLVLILDNCEHLLAAVAQRVHAWLDAIPGLKVIATSREALAADGEWVLPIGPLALPDVDASDADIAASEAVQLLADRATKVLPTLALAPADAATLAEICRRVDGLPLAIEIAAAQLRTVSPARLLALLQERFRLLSNLPHSLPRQRTMQTVIEWSFDHLQPAEQELLFGLAHCSGGCDFDAARALMGPGCAPEALTAALARLAEQALMTVRPGAGEPRYTLLETVGQFALERLGAQPLAAVLRRRFVAHFVTLAEAHDAQIVQRGQGAATLDHVDRERGNLLRAMQFCTQDDGPEAVHQGLRLAAALRHYWTARSQLRLGLELTQSALQRPGPTHPPGPALHWALVSQAQLLSALGKSEEAVRVMERVIAVASHLDDPAALCASFGYRASLLDRLGRFEAAAADHESARRLAAETGDDRLLADALARQGAHASLRGRFDDAAALLEQALPLRRRIGHGYRLAVLLINCGAVALQRARPAEARHHLHEAVSVLAAVGSDALDAALVHHGSTWLHGCGRWRELVVSRAAERQHRERASLPVDPEDQALAEAQLAEARAALGSADYEAACAAGRRRGIAEARAQFEAWLNEEPEGTT